MKKGFDFLKSRFEDNIKIYQDKYGLELPPLYSIFVKNFELGSNKLANDFFLDEDGDLSQLGTICFYINELKVYLNELIDLENVFQQWKNAVNDIEWKEKKLLRIAYLGQAGFGGLYVGCNKNNLDEIWLFNADSEERFIRISDNIFNFINTLEFSFDFSNLEEENYSKLHKNWNEDFWRINDV